MGTTEINAVEMVREIRDKFYEETKDLSSEELIRFISEKAARFRREIGSQLPNSIPGRPAA